MNKTLRKRLALTVPIVAVVPVLLYGSMPIRDWSIGIGVAMVCAMCLLGLYSIWTRPAAMLEGDRPEDADPPAVRWTGIRQDRRSLFR